MKKTYIVVIVGFIFILVLVTGFMKWKQSNRYFSTKEITQEIALKEMPCIEISTEEVQFAKCIREDTDVSLALESGKTTDLSIEKGTELARGVLPNNIRVGGFSIMDDSIFFDYFIDENRVILQIFTDNSISKTVSTSLDDGEVKAIYTNYNNEKYEKGTFKRTWKKKHKE